MRLVLLTFGDRLENHNQATFAVLSYLQSPIINGVTIVTDRPDLYQYLSDKIEVLPFSDSLMKEWQGKHDFFWRIKMKAIEYAAQVNLSDDILYVDSDTFLAKDLSQLQSGLASNNNYMHELEGKLSELTSKTDKKMWSSLKGKTFASVDITDKTEMWNAGVIALNKKDALKTIQHAIEICDEMCATNCTRRLIEQFAFSLALKNQGNLQAAKEEIVHYWGNKAEWNSKISEFFMYSQLTKSTLEQDCQRISEFDYRSMPIIIKEKNTKLKLEKLLSKIFQPKKIKYFKY